jgi:hypothetical protein
VIIRLQEREVPDLDELKERYERAKRRREKRTNLVLMLAGFAGALVSGVFFVILVADRVFSLTLLSFVLVCLMTFVSGLVGWITGKRQIDSINAIIDESNGPFWP